MRGILHRGPARSGWVFTTAMGMACFSFFLPSFSLLPAGQRAQAAGLPLPQSGVKTPYSPLAIPTRLERLGSSLEQLLDQHYHIVAAHPANGEEVMILTRPGRKDAPRQDVVKTGRSREEVAESHVLCALTMPDPATDQNVPTSRCWALNHPS